MPKVPKTREKLVCRASSTCCSAAVEYVAPAAASHTERTTAGSSAEPAPAHSLRNLQKIHDP